MSKAPKEIQDLINQLKGNPMIAGMKVVTIGPKGQEVLLDTHREEGKSSLDMIRELLGNEAAERAEKLARKEAMAHIESVMDGNDGTACSDVDMPADIMQNTIDYFNELGTAECYKDGVMFHVIRPEARDTLIAKTAEAREKTAQLLASFDKLISDLVAGNKLQ